MVVAAEVAVAVAVAGLEAEEAPGAVGLVREEAGMGVVALGVEVTKRAGW